MDILPLFSCAKCRNNTRNLIICVPCESRDRSVNIRESFTMVHDYHDSYTDSWTVWSESPTDDSAHTVKEFSHLKTRCMSRPRGGMVNAPGLKLDGRGILECWLTFYSYCNGCGVSHALTRSLINLLGTVSHWMTQGLIIISDSDDLRSLMQNVSWKDRMEITDGSDL